MIARIKRLPIRFQSFDKMLSIEDASRLKIDPGLSQWSIEVTFRWQSILDGHV